MYNTRLQTLTLFLILSCHSAIADESKPIIGRYFSYGGGSCCGNFAVSVDLRVKSRSTVEVSFLIGDDVWSIADKTSLSDEGTPKKVLKLMLNCNKRTYSEHDPEHQTNADLVIYRPGTAMEWGDYDQSKVTISPYKKDAPALTSYFEEICTYTDNY